MLSLLPSPPLSSSSLCSQTFSPLWLDAQLVTVAICGGGCAVTALHYTNLLHLWGLTEVEAFLQFYLNLTVNGLCLLLWHFLSQSSHQIPKRTKISTGRIWRGVWGGPSVGTETSEWVIMWVTEQRESSQQDLSGLDCEGMYNGVCIWRIRSLASGNQSAVHL